MRSACFLLLALGVSLPAFGGGAATVRSYPLPSGGSLELTVPMRWQEDVSWTKGESWPKVAYRPSEGNDFAVSVSVVSQAEVARDESHPDRVRNLVDRAARAALGLEEKDDLHLEEFDGPQGPGWFFSVVDPSVPDDAGPGVFRVMTQGAIGVDEVLLVATVLTQRQTSVELDAAVDLLRTARLSDRPGDSWRAPTQSHRNRGGAGERYELLLPEGFHAVSTSPLEARDEATGGYLSVEVAMRASDVRSELRVAEQAIERRSPEGWLLRRRGKTAIAGELAAEFSVVDEHRDEAVTILAIPHGEFTLVIEWRVHPSYEALGARRLRELLATLQFTQPAKG